MKSWAALCLVVAVIWQTPPASSFYLPQHAGRAACISPYRRCPQLYRPVVTCCPVPRPPVPAPLSVLVPPPPLHAPLRVYVRLSRPSPPRTPQIVVLPPPPPVRLPAVIWVQPLCNKPYGPCVPVRAWGTTMPGVYCGTPLATVRRIPHPNPCRPWSQRR